MQWKHLCNGVATLAAIPATLLMEPWIPLGHWLWGVIAGLCVLPSLITYGVPYFMRRFRKTKAEHKPLASTPTVDMTRMEEAKKRSDQTDADLRTFRYDVNTVLGRLLTPKAYRRDKSDDQDVERPK